MKFIYYLPLLILLCFSCTTTEERFTVPSPEGNITIDIYAKKSSTLDPYRVDIRAVGYNMETAVEVEVYIKKAELGETIIFNWKSERECVITFNEQDGTSRNFTLLFAQNEVVFAETN